MKDIYAKDCNYYINKDVGLIVCSLSGTCERFIEFMYENCSTSMSMRDYDKLMMPNIFYGIARCDKEDEWNEEFGKRLAFNKMKRKIMTSFYKRIKTYFDMQEKRLDDFEATCIAYRNKVERNMERE